MPIATEETACYVCGVAATLRCSVCKRTRYCSVEHQRQHWPAHRTQCAPPIRTFVEPDQFNSYYDGALFAYSQAKTANFGNGDAQTVVQRFVVERLNAIVDLGNATAARMESGEVRVSTLTENRARLLEDLHRLLTQEHSLGEKQLEHLAEPLEMQRQHLADKPLGYVCGYAHATLELMQRALQRDLSCAERATIDGATAIAAWTVALQAALERVEKKTET